MRNVEDHMEISLFRTMYMSYYILQLIIINTALGQCSCFVFENNVNENNNEKVFIVKFFNKIEPFILPFVTCKKCIRQYNLLGRLK